MGAETIALLVAHSDIQVMFIHVETQGGMHGSKLAGSFRDRWPTKRVEDEALWHRLGSQ